MNTGTVLENITKKIICRDKIITELYNIIGDPMDSYPNAIYFYGHTGTGKTSIITELLQQCASEYIILNCIECYTSKILFETIINSLCNYKKCDDLEFINLKCDNLEEFINMMRHAINPTKSYIICLDNAEKTRDMEANILPGFLRLQELTGMNITSVLISQLPFEKFFPKNGLSEVITIHCTQYNKKEIQKILLNDFELVKCYIDFKLITNKLNRQEYNKKFDILQKFEEDFYENYLNVFLNIFYRACRDLPELRMISRNCFEYYCEPVLNGIIAPNDVTKLWRNISGTLKTALSSVYMRTDYSLETKESLDKNNDCNQSLKRLAQSLELPYYAKFLLIASFLASHNAPKNDKRLFVKSSSKTKKRLQTINANAKIQDKMSTSLGPKSFTIDRLLAIFYSILDEKVGLTCNLLAQISSLVHLKFLTFVSGEHNVMEGSARLQCTVGLQFIVNIGKLVGFNVTQYLCDFL